MYQPKPVDTGQIELPEDLLELQEVIAKNVHEVWAQGRVREGWTFGEVRDDAAKKTPLLVPYEELPENEKDYDRRTAYETLKLIITLGYEVRK